ncbi:hypothetical protein V6Z11_D10G162600 [Gossypium hirsutum]
MHLQMEGKKKNLWHKRSVSVLLDFSNNTINIHSCDTHEWLAPKTPLTLVKRNIAYNDIYTHFSLQTRNDIYKYLFPTKEEGLIFLQVPTQNAHDELPSTRTHLTFGSGSHSNKYANK